MPVSVRPYPRFPVQYSITYIAGSLQGCGIVWEFSLNGWQLSGDLPLRVWWTCSVTINLPNRHSIFVAPAIVRWVRAR